MPLVVINILAINLSIDIDIDLMKNYLDDNLDTLYSVVYHSHTPVSVSLPVRISFQQHRSETGEIGKKMSILRKKSNKKKKTYRIEYPKPNGGRLTCKTLTKTKCSHLCKRTSIILLN